MKKVKFVGPSAIQLWDGRRIEPGTEIEVTKEQAEELVGRDPDSWRKSGGTKRDAEKEGRP